MVSFSRPNYRQLPVDMENQVILIRSIGQPRMQPLTPPYPAQLNLPNSTVVAPTNDDGKDQLQDESNNGR